MDLITLASIGGAAFVFVMLISAFIRQYMLRHDTQSNDRAQSTALIQEMAELEKIRTQMQSPKRFEIHNEMLKSNKDAISNLDARIEEILAEKERLVAHYVKITEEESSLILSKGQAFPEHKAGCYNFKETVSEKIKYYDDELKLMQQRRTALWDTHTIFQELLLAQEKARNQSLDLLYGQHSAMFEVVYLRHIAHTEAVSVKNIEASTLTFKDILMAPIQFLMQCFGIAGRGSGGIVLPNFTFVQTQEVPLPRAKKVLTENDQALLNRQRFFHLPRAFSSSNKKEKVMDEVDAVAVASSPKV